MAFVARDMQIDTLARLARKTPGLVAEKDDFKRDGG
jgi:hypothetical protein